MDEEEDIIPLPNVNSAILKKVKILIILNVSSKTNLGYSMGNSS